MAEQLADAVASIQDLIAGYESKLAAAQELLAEREGRLAQIAELATIPQPEPEPEQPAE